MPMTFDERRIWWQEEVDRIITKQGSNWERVWYWRGIKLQGLEPERKRAIVAAAEHAIERALGGARDEDLGVHGTLTTMKPVCVKCGDVATCFGTHSGFRCDRCCGHGDCVGHECGDDGHCEMLAEIQQEALKP